MRERRMRSSVGVKEEPAVTPPESSSSVTSSGEAPLQCLKKGPWSAAEDAILMEYVNKHGEGNWNAVQKNIGLQRCGKSCRLRWANHLRPNLKKGSFSPEEEKLILQLHAQLGNKWARMATQLPGRTDNEIKNYWNTRIKRRQRAGLPLYPPEIQRKLALMNQSQGLMLLQSQARSKNFISHFSPTTNTILNSATANNYAANYLLGKFDLSLQSQQPQSPNFHVKTEHPSTQLYHNYISQQKFPPQLMPPMMGQVPPMMGQVNDALFDDLPQEAHGSEELFNEVIFYDPLPTSCTAMAEPLPLSMPQRPPPPPLSLPSNTKHLSMDHLCRLSDSDIPIGLPAMKQSIETTVNQNISNPLEMNPIQETVTQPEKIIDLFDSSSGMAEDERKLDMQPFNPNFSMGNDWNFESSAWENIYNIP